MGGGGGDGDGRRNVRGNAWRGFHVLVIWPSLIIFFVLSFPQSFINKEDFASMGITDKKPVFGDERIERIRRWVSRDLVNLDIL